MKYSGIIKGTILKDFRLDIRYPFFFIFKFFEIIIFVTIAYYSSKLVTKVSCEGIQQEYFPYLLIGLAFFSIFRTGLYTYTEELSRYIQTGILESLISLPVNEIWIILFSGIWRHMITLIRLLFYFFIGISSYGAHFYYENGFGIIAVYFISVLCFSGLGLISGSILICFKKAEPVNWMISQICLITGGVIFPVHLLPDSIQMVSKINPVTYALKFLRLIMLENKSVPLMEWLIFISGALMIFIMGIFCLHFSLKKAKETGILSFY